MTLNMSIKPLPSLNMDVLVEEILLLLCLVFSQKFIISPPM